ncbi:MAG: histidinol-phosphate transaminase [Microscillaceae bacterium]|nr:histidinol-phosphate transaminase [Microscillaceae bacterium]
MNRRSLLKSTFLGVSGLSVFPSLVFSRSQSRIQAQRLRHALIPLADEIEPEFLKTGKPQVKVRLLANENPYGPSPKAKKAIIDAIDASFMYPGQSMKALIEEIAKVERVDPKQVMLGAGSSQLLLATFLAYGPKGKFVVADPGYISRVEELDLDKVPLTSDYKHDLKAMADRVSDKTSLVYICNPNNPTGTEVDAATLRDFCASVSAKVPVMVDEAYIDYVKNPQESSMIDCIRKGQNVIVLRTFSKLHAFAGLRIGYCIAQPKIIEEIEKFHSVNSLAHTSLEAARASYQDAEFAKMVLSKTQEAKDFVYKTLQDHGFSYIPSCTNFVLFPLRMKGDTFIDKMSDEGVQVRRWEFNQQHWCRVSLGKMEDMKIFAEAFSKVVS